MSQLFAPEDLTVVGLVIGFTVLVFLLVIASYFAGRHDGRREGAGWRQEAVRYRAERDRLAWRLRTRPRPLEAPRPRPGYPASSRPPMPRRQPRRTPPKLTVPIEGWDDLAPTVEVDTVRTLELPAAGLRLHAPLAGRPALEEAAR